MCNCQIKVMTSPTEITINLVIAQLPITDYQCIRLTSYIFQIFLHIDLFKTNIP